MKNAPLRALLLVPLVAVACKPDQGEISPAPGPSMAQPQPAPSAALSPTTTAAAVKPPEGPPACTVGTRKVWGSGANKLTGLAVAELGEGRYGVGLALGHEPHVLVIEGKGEGKLVKIPAAKGTALEKAPKAEEGTRKIMRVTPFKWDGEKALAFVDYHDEYKSKRRRVACGPADTDDAWHHFDGVPWLDRADKPSGQERAKLLKGHDYDRGHAEEDKPAAANEAEDEKGYHELRDCRTFSDGAGKAWVVGSELEADEKADQSLEWKSTLIVDTGHKDKDVHLSEVALRGDPPTLASFEVPVSHAFEDGSILLATRFGSSLRAGILGGKTKRLQGKLVSYTGFPTIPHVAEDGKDLVLLLSVAKEKGNFALRALRVSGEKHELPAKLATVETHAVEAGHQHDDEKDIHGHSETDPTFLRDTKGRRWISFIEGARGRGKLEIVPVDENFKAVGKRFSVFEDSALASEARLLPLADGGILVVSLREGDKGAVEVVTEELRCEVVKE